MRRGAMDGDPTDFARRGAERECAERYINNGAPKVRSILGSSGAEVKRSDELEARSKRPQE
jgi:hypothetical protein